VELLSDVFLYVVESGLRNDDTCFVAGTFDFLQVCRHWNKVAVAFPRLWVWWIAKAGKAWDLFNARSGDAPLFLTWQGQFPDPTRDAFMDTKTPRRFRRLNFRSSRLELEYLLGALDSNSFSITSSIRVFTDSGKRGEHLTRFLSLPFPKLSELNITNFLPDPSSAIFTTSSLTSLTLNLREDDERRYTRSQFSRILQQHPNLRELNLGEGAIPLVDQSEEPSSVVLPQLVDLRLDGSGTVIAGLMALVSMSPLHNVVIRFQHTYLSNVWDLSDTVKQILTAYYKCQGLEHPRKVDHLTVSSRHELVASARSSPTLECPPTYSLELQFYDMRNALAKETIPLFPSEHTRVFATTGLNLDVDDWRIVLLNMKGLLSLRLDRLDIGPVLDALCFDGESAYLDLPTPHLIIHTITVEPYLPIAPRLQSLSFRNLDIISTRSQKLFNVLERRFNRHIGLKILAVQLCRVPTGGYREGLKGLVEGVAWAGVEEVA